METISLTLRLDKEYRNKIEEFRVKFEDYLIGVVLEHLMSSGPMEKLINRLKKESVAAHIELVNRAGAGEVMREFYDQN